MNLEKMFEMQKALDERIIKEKGLGGQDLLPNTYVALDTELAEFANEGRWFKHWSNNQKPRTILSTTVGATPENAAFFRCENDNCGEHLSKKDFENLFDPDYEECPICKVGSVTAFRDKNPLLEEYVDCLHFFLSIAIKKNWQDAMNIPEEAFSEMEKNGFEGGLSGVLLEMKWMLLNSYMTKDKRHKKTSFTVAWGLFLSIGTIGFGFTLEQIEAAYMEKNAVNHQRQQEGY
ncbi:dUTP diphosphatase [Bacillus vallismortis]|uniref:dUTP diphosphatase n=1 Tax=Bacillus vallismortis TaxID=72361 RepID=UPI0022806C7C|nr:dUTP diphosphatase [Bacillus vallismortis]MCY8309972.1 dUTP diphosphatase [Bacillus vallismortis]